VDVRRSVGRTATAEDHETATGFLVAATIVATVLGGILGVEVRSGWPARSPLVILVLGLVALAGLAAIHLQTRGRSARWDHCAEVSSEDPAARGPGDTARPPQPPAATPEAPEPAATGAQVTIALPVPSGQWWDRGAPTPGPRSAGAAAAGVSAPDLETYLEASIVAQCPRCAAFYLDPEAVPPGYRFACRDCGWTWEWQPGQPWPPVKVSPRLRRPGVDPS